MDRPLEPSVLVRDRLRRGAAIVLPVLGLVALIVWLPGWMRPAVARARIRTAVVTAGPIEAVISAGGTILPEIERVVSSPLDARVLRVLERPGARLEPGDPVLQLDVSESVLALERILKDSRVKDTQRAQTRLTLERSLATADGQIQVKTLQLQAAHAKLEGDRALSKDGLLSREALRQSELAARQAEIELAQLRDERHNTERSTTLQAEGLMLERASLDKEAAEARRLLDLATTKADRSGVLTWIVSQEGALVRKGDILARIADLSSFRVDASVADVHAGRLHEGMPVVVKISETVSLDGTIADVLPTIENGVVRFTVALRDRSHAQLRPSLRADVFVITDRKPRTLRIKRGPFADGAGTLDAFVIRGDRAVRTRIVLGLSSVDEVEIVSGVSEGDELIISDMRDYQHLTTVKVR